MTATNTSRERLFGRFKGRPLSARQAQLMRERLPDLSPDLSQSFSWDRLGWAPDHDRIWLEIGFGGGEHLVHMAARMPDVEFIGCEPFVNGVAKALSAVDEIGLTNVRLFHGDALKVMGWLPDRCLETVCLLYPDPWPKRRHRKRRLINPATLDKMARLLKSGGEVRFASDIPDYVNWTLGHFARHPDFYWTAQTADDWRRPFADWPGTRYEAKALAQGRGPAYLTFQHR